MTEFKGTGLNTGLCTGRTVLWKDRPAVSGAHVTASDPETELKRLESGIQRTSDMFSAQAESLSGENPELAALLETYTMILEGGELTEAAAGKIADGMSAEDAVVEAGEEFAAIFEASGDEYTAGRAADVRDIAAKAASNIADGDSPADGDFPDKGPYILCAADISPADLLSLVSAGKKPDGIILAGGSVNSHTSIICRTFGIPSVIGLGSNRPQTAGILCTVDSGDGTVTVNPDEEYLAAFEKRAAEYRAERERLQKYRDVTAVTKDGRKLKIYCNIASPDDVEAVLENGGEGIGLFRSEFLYIGRDTPPTEEEQYTAYSSVLSGMKDRPVIIRTCDIGSDKNASYMNLPPEENPALGTRGIRLSLARPEMFRTQLRALYRASVFGNLSIMFPMISEASEIAAAKAMCALVRSELDAEGIEYADVKLGIMIETPAAALTADELAGMCDFFSIGSNDLAQYTTAADRMSGQSTKVSPAVLKLIEMTVNAAHAKGIPVGICGQMAADSEMTEFLAGCGIDELSVPASGVLELRESIVNYY